MKRGNSELATGAVAGLAGTVAMAAMRSFDERYAPRTVPPVRERAGRFLVDRARRAAHRTTQAPEPLRKAASVTEHVAYGTLAGMAYSWIRGRNRSTSTLRDGALIGLALYAAGHLVLHPLLGLERPAWKQAFPEIAGEVLRHVAYGVTTAATYGALHDDV